MKEQWKEKLNEELWMFEVSSMEQKRIEDFISQLLENETKKSYFEGCKDGMSNEDILNLRKEVKKDLINQILSEAPEDKEYAYGENDSVNGFNQANAQWREIINKLK